MEKIVGFDIGESSVKLVYFAGADLKKAVTAELPDNMVSGSRILSMDAMADFLRQTAKSNGIPLTHAALVLPSTEVFTRELVMPAMTEQQLLYNLPYEFRDYLTEEKNKYFFDYSMREVLRDESGQPTEMNLLACATLKTLKLNFNSCCCKCCLSKFCIEIYDMFAFPSTVFLEQFDRQIKMVKI